MDETREFRAPAWVTPLYRLFALAELGGAAFVLYLGVRGWGIEDAIFGLLLLVLPLLIAAVVSFQHARMIDRSVIRLDKTGLFCHLPQSSSGFFMRPGKDFECKWRDIEKVSWRKKRRGLGQNKLTAGEIVVETSKGIQTFSRPMVRRPEEVGEAIAKGAGLTLILPPPLDAARRK